MKKRLIVFFCILCFCSINADEIESTELDNGKKCGESSKTYISGFNFTNKLVTYEKKDGMAILEGDILIGSLSEVDSWNNQIGSATVQPRSIIITGDRYRWINNIIPYQFGANVPQVIKDRVMSAIEHIEENTHINFVYRNGSNAPSFPDYVNIISDSNSCRSYVGRIGGQQNLNLGLGCGVGAAVHEFGHVLGLWHEQSRQDRDNFVQINWDNIIPECKYNFEQHIHDGDDINGYDYHSIMHYHSHAFSKNGLATITSLQSVEIGQSVGLSQGDIDSINHNYPLFEPVAKLNKESYSVYLGDSVFIDARNSFDPQGSTLRYDWNLGDGTIITNGSEYIEHTYAKKGKYQILLTIYDQDGNMDQHIVTSIVYSLEEILPILDLEH